MGLMPQVRPFAVNDAMSKRVHKEFSQLAVEEKKLNIPVMFAIEGYDQLQSTQVGAIQDIYLSLSHHVHLT